MWMCEPLLYVHVGLPWTYMNLVLPEGARKLGGGGGDAVEGVHLYMPCCAPPLC